MSNVLTLFGGLPASVAIGWLAAQGIPYLSALATKAPTWATGFITLVLSFADGFFSDWAANFDRFDWKAALGATLGALVTAGFHQLFLIKSRQPGQLSRVEAHLYAFPRRAAAVPSQQVAA